MFFIQNYIQYHVFLPPSPSPSPQHTQTHCDLDFKVIVLLFFYLIDKREFRRASCLATGLVVEKQHLIKSNVKVFKDGLQECFIQQKIYRLCSKITIYAVIFLNNVYIFVSIQQDCLTNMVFMLIPTLVL